MSAEVVTIRRSIEVGDIIDRTDVASEKGETGRR
jgi:hypothetical protein